LLLASRPRARVIPYAVAADGDHLAAVITDARLFGLHLNGDSLAWTASGDFYHRALPAGQAFTATGLLDNHRWVFVDIAGDWAIYTLVSYSDHQRSIELRMINWRTREDRTLGKIDVRTRGAAVVTRGARLAWLEYDGPQWDNDPGRPPATYTLHLLDTAAGSERALATFANPHDAPQLQALSERRLVYALGQDGVWAIDLPDGQPVLLFRPDQIYPGTARLADDWFVWVPSDDWDYNGATVYGVAMFP
jgi:hypothetical protein